MTDQLHRATPATPLFRLPTYPDSEESRRDILKKLMGLGSVAMGTMALSACRGTAETPAAAAAENKYKVDLVNGPYPTPDQFMGPYYPIKKPTDGGSDMTKLPGRDTALGDLIEVSGQVLNLHGEPCPDVKMEIWQPNAAGRYIHQNDHNPAPIDPNFDGYANIMTGKDGRYKFKTVKPGAYPITPEFWRPPHIHFDLSGKVNRLTTQMYFPNEPLNDKDPILQVAWAKESLIASEGEAGAGPKQMSWDIVLIEG